MALTRPIEVTRITWIASPLENPLPSNWDDLVAFCNKLEKKITSDDYSKLLKHINATKPKITNFATAAEALKHSAKNNREEITHALAQQLCNYIAKLKPEDLQNNSDVFISLCNAIGDKLKPDDYAKFISLLPKVLPPITSITDAMKSLQETIETNQKEVSQQLFIQLYEKAINDIKQELIQFLKIDVNCKELFSSEEISYHTKSSKTDGNIEHTDEMVAKVLWNYILMIERIRLGDENSSEKDSKSKLAITDIIYTTEPKKSPVVTLHKYLRKDIFSNKFTHNPKEENAPDFFRTFTNLQIITSAFAKQLHDHVAAKNPTLLNNVAPATLFFLHVAGMIKTKDLVVLLSDFSREFIWHHLRSSYYQVTNKFDQTKIGLMSLVEKITDEHEQYDNAKIMSEKAVIEAFDLTLATLLEDINMYMLQLEEMDKLLKPFPTLAKQTYTYKVEDEKTKEVVEKDLEISFKSLQKLIDGLATNYATLKENFSFVQAALTKAQREKRAAQAKLNKKDAAHHTADMKADVTEQKQEQKIQEPVEVAEKKKPAAEPAIPEPVKVEIKQPEVEVKMAEEKPVVEIKQEEQKPALDIKPSILEAPPTVIEEDEKERKNRELRANFEKAASNLFELNISEARLNAPGFSPLFKAKQKPANKPEASAISDDDFIETEVDLGDANEKERELDSLSLYTKLVEPAAKPKDILPNGLDLVAAFDYQAEQATVAPKNQANDEKSQLDRIQTDFNLACMQNELDEMLDTERNHRDLIDKITAHHDKTLALQNTDKNFNDKVAQLGFAQKNLSKKLRDFKILHDDIDVTNEKGLLRDSLAHLEKMRLADIAQQPSPQMATEEVSDKEPIDPVSAPVITKPVISAPAAEPTFWQRHGSKVIAGITFGLAAIGIGLAIYFLWPILAVAGVATLIKLGASVVYAAIAATAAAGIISDNVINAKVEQVEPDVTSAPLTGTRLVKIGDTLGVKIYEDVKKTPSSSQSASTTSSGGSSPEIKPDPREESSPLVPANSSGMKLNRTSSDEV